MDEILFISMMLSSLLIKVEYTECYGRGYNEKIKSKYKTMEQEFIDPYYTGPECAIKKNITINENPKMNNIAHPSSRNSYTYPAMPVCLRCAICIAVAEKLNETFTLAHNVYEEKINGIAEILRSLCNNGFENYELREVKGYHVVTDVHKLTQHITSYLDGRWTQKLRDVCHFYLKEFGEEKLYKTWFDGDVYPPHDMINTLCRSSGVFRDCINIEDIVIPKDVKHYFKYCTNKYVQIRTACP